MCIRDRYDSPVSTITKPRQILSVDTVFSPVTRHSSVTVGCKGVADVTRFPIQEFTEIEFPLSVHLYGEHVSLFNMPEIKHTFVNPQGCAYHKSLYEE